MSTAHILLLGAIAGVTILLGLPVGRMPNLGVSVRNALAAMATGILLFLFWDVLSNGVDPVAEQLENADLEPLSALGNGRRATIVRLAEHDGELLHWFYDQGLTPGAEIEIHEVQPAAGQFTVRLNGSLCAVGEKAAAGLFVRRAA